MTVDYGNYSIFLSMGNARFISSTVVRTKAPVGVGAMVWVAGFSGGVIAANKKTMAIIKAVSSAIPRIIFHVMFLSSLSLGRQQHQLLHATTPRATADVAIAASPPTAASACDYYLLLLLLLLRRRRHYCYYDDYCYC